MNPMRIADPTPGYNREFDQASQDQENKYQQACSHYDALAKDVEYPEIEEALYESGQVFRDAIQKAARLQDSAEVGRLVMACLEKHLWSAACKKYGIEND